MIQVVWACVDQILCRFRAASRLGWVICFAALLACSKRVPRDNAPGTDSFKGSSAEAPASPQVSEQTPETTGGEETPLQGDLGDAASADAGADTSGNELAPVATATPDPSSTTTTTTTTTSPVPKQTPFAAPPVIGVTHGTHVRAHFGDIDGDKKADILWRHGTTGKFELWRMDGKTVLSNAEPVPAENGVQLFSADLNWRRVGLGDFNGDGKQDSFFRNVATGLNAVWLMNGERVTAAESTPQFDLAWEVLGTGDFNGDGKTDLFWRNNTTFTTAIWLMDGKNVALAQNGGNVPLAWQVMGTGTFNADRKADIIWRNSVSGENALWLMDGTTVLEASVLEAVPDLGWRMQGIADFNRDGNDDILWRHSTGVHSLWAMNGKTRLGSLAVPAVADANWTIQGVGDFNGDLSPDIVWRNALSGQIGFWLMSANSILVRGETAPTP